LQHEIDSAFIIAFELDRASVHFNSRFYIILQQFLDPFDDVIVIDVEPHFRAPDGTLLFADNAGNEYYRDPSHLSGYGAGALRADLVKALAMRP